MDTSLTCMYSEAFVLTRLLSWGYPATLVSGPLTYDLIVDVDGVSYRVQVKSTSRECEHDNGENSLSFSVSRGGGEHYDYNSYDILACVGVPKQKILFLPFTNKLCIRRKVSTFTKKKEIESWEECLKYLNSVGKKN